jgi:NAD+ diphosphatase
MIQDIHPHHLSNKFIPAIECSENDCLFHFKNNALLLKKSDDSLEFPTRKDLNVVDSGGIFLFKLDQLNCFLIEDCTVPENAGYIYEEISFFRTHHQKEVAWASLLGLHLMNWYSLNRYCGKCGSRNQPKKDERALICPACGSIVYPHISPAIIVAVLCRDKILLARGNNFRSNYFSLVAGYADVGESLEDAVAREVKEEVGLVVTNIRYYKSQPWPLSGSMMIGYIAEADDLQPITPDRGEIEEAKWFTRDNLPNHPPTLSIAGEMIDKFVKGELA